MSFIYTCIYWKWNISEYSTTFAVDLRHNDGNNPNELLNSISLLSIITEGILLIQDTNELNLMSSDAQDELWANNINSTADNRRIVYL